MNAGRIARILDRCERYVFATEAPIVRYEHIPSGVAVSRTRYGGAWESPAIEVPERSLVGPLALSRHIAALGEAHELAVWLDDLQDGTLDQIVLVG